MIRPSGSWWQRCVRGSASSAGQHEQVVQAVVAAAAAGDSQGLIRMLHPRVVLTVDGGGVVAAPSGAVEGSFEVGAHLREVLLDATVSLRVESVNGAPGIVVCQDGRVAGVLSIRVRNGQIVEAWLVVNPHKLTHWKC